MTPVGGHQPHRDRASWAVLARLRGHPEAFPRPPTPPSRRWQGGGLSRVPPPYFSNLYQPY